MLVASRKLGKKYRSNWALTPGPWCANPLRYPLAHSYFLGVLLCNYLDLYWLLTELKTPHTLSMFFWARIPRRPNVGHDNLKVRVYSDWTHQRQIDGVAIVYKL